jgi:hypothetical protein
MGEKTGSEKTFFLREGSGCGRLLVCLVLSNKKGDGGKLFAFLSEIVFNLLEFLPG